jgi:hypothetical protein
MGRVTDRLEADADAVKLRTPSVVIVGSPSINALSTGPTRWRCSVRLGRYWEPVGPSPGELLVGVALGVGIAEVEGAA